MTLRKQHILIIEDDDALAAVVEEVLSAHGFAVRSESTGHGALAYAAEQAPDLVILDLVLPDMSGYDVAHALKHMSKPWEPALVMLTSMGKPAEQLRGFRCGADAYLTKPFNPNELLMTVRLLLGESEYVKDFADV